MRIAAIGRAFLIIPSKTAEPVGARANHLVSVAGPGWSTTTVGSHFTFTQAWSGLAPLSPARPAAQRCTAACWLCVCSGTCLADRAKN